MRIVAVEAFDEILVLVVVAAAAVATMIVMRLLLLSVALHSVIHVARNCAAARIYVRPSLHLLSIHCDRVILIHFLRLKLFFAFDFHSSEKLPVVAFFVNYFSFLSRFLKADKRGQLLKFCTFEQTSL